MLESTANSENELITLIDVGVLALTFVADLGLTGFFISYFSTPVS